MFMWEYVWIIWEAEHEIFLVFVSGNGYLGIFHALKHLIWSTWSGSWYLTLHKIGHEYHSLAKHILTSDIVYVNKWDWSNHNVSNIRHNSQPINDK